MKVAIFEVESKEVEQYLSSTLREHELSFYRESLDESIDFQQLKDVQAISVFIYSKVNSTVLEKLPVLVLIATRSTGFDHIDIEECKKRGVLVANVPSYGENTVAEHTFALILALSRKIVTSVDRTRLGNFEVSDLKGFDLKNKAIGIVGLGKIGAHVARIAYGFEMKILGYDPYPNEQLKDEFGVNYVDMEDLLGQSDIISLHLPLNDKTKHLINKESFSKVKKGAYIINTSRGGLIETTSLVKALNEHIIAGAGLDVLEDELNIKEELEVLSPDFSKKQLIVNTANNILLKDPRVIITPHNAFNSKEALGRILETTVENLEEFSKGEPVNLIT